VAHDVLEHGHGFVDDNSDGERGAISDTLSRLNPARYIAANVPKIETGKARAGIIVADNLRTNRKITSTTRIDRQGKGMLHLRDGGLDDRRKVVTDRNVDSAWELGANGGQQCPDAIGDFDPYWRRLAEAPAPTKPFRH
jgi:hypothetical protein